MQHLDEGTIHAWLDGALPMTEAREVEQHVGACAACSAMVAEARGLVAGASRIVSSLDVVRGNVIPKKPAGGAGKSLWHSLHLTPARAALAATLMIAVSTLLTVRHDTDTKFVPPAAPATVAPAPAGVEAPAINAQSAAPASRPAPAPSVRGATASSDAPVSGAKDEMASLAKPKAEAKADLAFDAVKPRVDSLRVEPAKTAVAGVAAAPPAAPAPVAAVGATTGNSLDSSIKKTLAKAAEMDSVRSRPVELRRGAPAFAAARNAGPSSLITMKCFQFAEPQGLGIPQRFALQALAQDTAQRIIRAVDENGRLDTVITGGVWTRATPTEVTVRFASNTQLLTLPIRDAGFGVAAVDSRQEAARQRTGPSVTPMACRP